jgi:hypothetical protein
LEKLCLFLLIIFINYFLEACSVFSIAVKNRQKNWIFLLWFFWNYEGFFWICINGFFSRGSAWSYRNWNAVKVHFAKNNDRDSFTNSCVDRNMTWENSAVKCQHYLPELCFVNIHRKDRASFLHSSQFVSGCNCVALLSAIFFEI